MMVSRLGNSRISSRRQRERAVDRVRYWAVIVRVSMSVLHLLSRCVCQSVDKILQRDGLALDMKSARLHLSYKRR